MSNGEGWGDTSSFSLDGFQGEGEGAWVAPIPHS